MRQNVLICRKNGHMLKLSKYLLTGLDIRIDVGLIKLQLRFLFIHHAAFVSE
jgi:hypothetical protein